MGSVKHRCGQSPDGPDPVNPRPGPAPADRGADEGQSRFCSQCEVLTARLAEVEAERDRAQSLARLNSLMGGEGPVMVPVEAARCPDCGSERYRHHRSDVVAERDRLAQELEDANAKLAIAESVEVEDKSGVELLFDDGWDGL